MTLIHSSSTNREIAERGTILQGLVGSTVHGLNLPGTDDTDLMGICIEPAAFVIGLQPFEQYVFRSAEEHRAPGLPSTHSQRSGAGDIDLTTYSLRKWARLALGGNPTVLLLLFVPEIHLQVKTVWGDELRQHPEWFASKLAGGAFLGYLTQQKQRLTGEIGQMRVTRTELVDAYGYDVKFAGHMIRLGYQGIEYMQTGRLTLPMAESERQYILSVRRGEVLLNDVLTRAGLLERELKDLRDTSWLPDKPDHAAVDAFLQKTYLDAWEVGRP